MYETDRAPRGHLQLAPYQPETIAQAEQRGYDRGFTTATSILSAEFKRLQASTRDRALGIGACIGLAAGGFLGAVVMHAAVR